MGIANVNKSAATAGPASTYKAALIMVTTLFFMWGFLTCLNDILIPHLKSIFDLNYAEVMLVQFSFFSAFLIFALPSVLGHHRELTADGLRRKKESNIVHGSGPSLMCGLRHGVGMAAKGALYRETLQATGMTTRIFHRHKRVCADAVQNRLRCLGPYPAGKRALLRASQPTMAPAI